MKSQPLQLVEEFDFSEQTYLDYIDSDKSVEGVIKAIKEGRFEVKTEPLKLSFAVPYIVKGIIKQILYYPFRLSQK